MRRWAVVIWTSPLGWKASPTPTSARLIAYLVPGATVLVGFSQFSPVLRSWFGAAAGRRPDDRRFPVPDGGVYRRGHDGQRHPLGFVDTLHS